MGSPRQYDQQSIQVGYSGFDEAKAGVSLGLRQLESCDIAGSRVDAMGEEAVLLFLSIEILFTYNQCNSGYFDEERR